MSLSDSDWTRLDRKFQEVHERINPLLTKVTEADGAIGHHTNPETICPKVACHERERHNLGKTIKMLAGTIASAIGIMELIRYLERTHP